MLSILHFCRDAWFWRSNTTSCYNDSEFLILYWSFERKLVQILSLKIGAADSGDLNFDLPNLFTAIAEAAAARNTAIALVIDEMQYLQEKEFAALIRAIHAVAQKKLPLVPIGAGLPHLVGRSEGCD